MHLLLLNLDVESIFLCNSFKKQNGGADGGKQIFLTVFHTMQCTVYIHRPSHSSPLEKDINRSNYQPTTLKRSFLYKSCYRNN